MTNLPKKERFKKGQRGIVLFALLFFVQACNKLPLGGSFELVSGSFASNQAKAKSAPSVDPKMQFKTEADKERFYSSIVREMVQQVYLQDPKSNKDVASWANVLLQGGSIEGIYHGLVLSNDYSALEKGTAKVKAIRFFAEESVALHDPTLSQKDIESKATQLVQDNISASLFSLKRQLGEKVLQEIAARKNDKASFADWYAKIVLRWNSQGVAFGLPERNKSDLEFHKNWALTHPVELVEWELLNRVHRVLNQLGGISLDGK